MGKYLHHNCCTGVEWENIYTIDGDAEAVERALISGGCSETGYDLTELVGVEVIDAQTPAAKSEP